MAQLSLPIRRLKESSLALGLGFRGLGVWCFLGLRVQWFRVRGGKFRFKRDLWDFGESVDHPESELEASFEFLWEQREAPDICVWNA